jgi:hypothetical protein
VLTGDHVIGGTRFGAASITTGAVGQEIVNWKVLFGANRGLKAPVNPP